MTGCVQKQCGHELAAVRRVLSLLDGYLAKQDPHELTTDGCGLATWAELRAHVRCALRLGVLQENSSKECLLSEAGREPGGPG